MKNNYKNAKFSWVGYFLFLIPITIVVSLGILLFTRLDGDGFSQSKVALLLGLYILFASLMISFVDVLRRKIMVYKPTEQILKATQKIEGGNFDVKLVPTHEINKWDEYDLIMNNINKMAEALKKSEVLKSEFISNVSHEIKTPLSVICNYAKILNSTNLTEAERAKFSASLVKQTAKLSNLVSNILKLNKLENQSYSATEEVNIGEVLRESVIQFEDLFDEKNIDFTCDITDVFLKVEPSLLELVFNNLISNAIKFTDSGGKIEIMLKKEGQYAWFRIEDNGCGISEEAGERIFEKFYQAETSHSGEGNGLGLALVKRVIDLIGGEISVKSEVGVGSAFTIKLKRGKDEYN